MKNYKVIAVGSDEFISGEYAHRAETMEEAKEIAKTLYEKVDNGNYPDLRIEIYPINEYINSPSEDYPVLYKDYDGNFVWSEMKVGTYCRIGIKTIF